MVACSLSMRESSLSDLDNSAAGGYAIYCGLDVGNSEHHACALDPTGKKIYDKPLPNDEAALTGVLTGLAARGRVLVIIDQPAAIGALVIAVARHLGIEVAYLPGLAMRRIADLRRRGSRRRCRPGAGCAAWCGRR